MTGIFDCVNKTQGIDGGADVEDVVHVIPGEGVQDRGGGTGQRRQNDDALQAPSGGGRHHASHRWQQR